MVIKRIVGLLLILLGATGVWSTVAIAGNPLLALFMASVTAFCFGCSILSSANKAAENASEQTATDKDNDKHFY
jgi:hypothetical protein